MSWTDLDLEKLSKTLDLDVRAAQPVGGGCTNETYKLKLGSGGFLFLKTRPQGERAFLNEARGLEALREQNVLSVPDVVKVTEDVLVLSWVESGPAHPETMMRFGEALARFHLKSRVSHVGFHEDNFIGTSPQMNTPMRPVDEWASFFFENRMLVQLGLLSERRLVDEMFVAKIHALKPIVQRVLGASQIPSCLLHGDLWSGNYMIDRAGQAVVFDPAVSFGDPETDLALTRLFGGFGEDFYRGYAEVTPLRDGWKDREAFYQLYHLLNHVAMVGTSYLNQAKSCLETCLLSC